MPKLEAQSKDTQTSFSRSTGAVDAGQDPDPWMAALRGRMSADGAAARLELLAGAYPPRSYSHAQQLPQPQPTQTQPYPQSRFRSPCQRRLLAQAQVQRQLQGGLKPETGAAPAFTDLSRTVPDVSDEPSLPGKRGWGLGGGGHHARRGPAEARRYAPSAPEVHVRYGPTWECDEGGTWHSSGEAAAATGDGDGDGDASGADGACARGRDPPGQRSPRERSSPGLLRRLMAALFRRAPKARVSCDGGGGGGAAAGGQCGGGALGDLLRSSRQMGPRLRQHTRQCRSWAGNERFTGDSDVPMGMGRGNLYDDNDNGGAAGAAYDGSSDDAEQALKLLQMQRCDSRVLHRARLGLGDRPQSMLLKPPGTPRAPPAGRRSEAGGGASAGASASGSPLSRRAATPLPNPGASVSSPALLNPSAARKPPASPFVPSSPLYLPPLAAAAGAAGASPPQSAWAPLAATRTSSPLPKLTAPHASHAAWGVPELPATTLPPAGSVPISHESADGREIGLKVSSIAHLRARLVSMGRNHGADSSPSEQPLPASPSVTSRQPSSPLALDQLREQPRCLSEPVAVLASTRTVKRLAIGLQGGATAGFGFGGDVSGGAGCGAS